MYGIFLISSYVVQIIYSKQFPYYFVRTFSSLLCPTKTLCLTSYTNEYMAYILLFSAGVFKSFDNLMNHLEHFENSYPC